ncbi:ephrin type-A receptor 4-like isoform X2 [Montipora foliosa]
MKPFWITLFVVIKFTALASSEQVYIWEEPRCTATCAWTRTFWETATPSGVGWYHPSGSGGNLLDRYTVCNFDNSEEPNNWLRSGLILVGDIKRLDVTVEYRSRECPTLNFCRNSSYAYVWESNASLAADDIPSPISNYRIYRRFANISRLSDNRETLTMPLQVTSKYIVLGFRDRGGCRTLYSLKVSYKACTEKAALADSLVYLPRTFSQEEPISVEGSCAPNSVQSVSGNLTVLCDSNGEWNTSQLEGRCVCKEGMENLGGICQACPPGKFNERKGFNCTEIPSAPKNVTVTFVNQTAIGLTWVLPETADDKSRVYYDVECWETCNENKDNKCVNRPCDNDVNYIPSKQGINKTQVMITNLSSFVNYKLTIYSRNRVSDLAREMHGLEGNFALINVITDESRPGKPEVSVERLSERDAVFVSWTLGDKNGIILNYNVTYIRADDMVDRRSVNTTQMSQHFEGLMAGKAYEFQVYAVNSYGKGPTGVTNFILQNGGNAEELLVPIAAGGGGLLFILLVIMVVVIFITRRRNRNVHRNYINSIERGEEMNQRQYVDPSNYLDHMELLATFTTEVDRSKVKLEEMIGQGEFADVYRGTKKTQGKQQVVAVKVLRPGSSAKNQRDFLSEASIMGQFNHPNVIKLIGVVTNSRPMMIITELLEQGSLESFLEARKGILTSLQLSGMARGVACGMVYLSEMNFIHRDLAARNILVGDNMSCKVSDFGLSRELADDNPESEYQTQGGKIPVRWTAPEALHKRIFSSASDVWSYGILLWEIMSFAERPYWEWSNVEVVSRVTSGYRLPPPQGCPKIIHSLMLDCWEAEKNKRPTFAEIVCRLNEIIRSPDSLIDDASPQSKTQSVGNDITRPESVREWLISINMEHYVKLFTAANIDSLEKVDKLEEKDLREMGISLIGHRNKMKKSIKSRRSQFMNTGMEDHE